LEFAIESQIVWNGHFINALVKISGISAKTPSYWKLAQEKNG
jgi:hypothetical protein